MRYNVVTQNLFYIRRSGQGLLHNTKTQQLRAEIEHLKQKRQAVILAHYYQLPEIQDIADYVGDSLELARKAASTEAKVIVFCGVHFMAESAAILSPDKIVLLPDAGAGCPMADMVTPEALRAKKRTMPGAVVVTYVNSSAEVKAESDICCTSANVVKVIQAIPPDQEILFIPDRNLGDYAATQTGRKLVSWAGYCYVHDQLSPADVRQAKARYPKAKVLVHPECNPAVIAMADYVSSTSGILRFAKESVATEFLIGTEGGILHQLSKQNPTKKFYIIHEKLACKDMQATTLLKLKECLTIMQPQITVPPDIRKRALNSLERMLK